MEGKAFKNLKIRVITLSDRASQGIYPDKSGVLIKEILENFFSDLDWKYEIAYNLIPDSEVQLSELISKSIENKEDIIITTGGTGVGPRDFTPEVIKKFPVKEITGIMENIRIKYGSEKPNALLSRGIAGVIHETQIYALPGSAKAVREYMTEILKTIEHLVFMIHGVDTH